MGGGGGGGRRSIYKTYPLYAAPGDYLTVVRTITFPAGTTEAFIAVNTTEDSISELPEQFTALLSNPSEGLVVGPIDTAAVDIMDDDGIV